MGKKFFISEEEKQNIKLLYGIISEQRISDLPQNQQTNTTPKPNIGTPPKSKDLRTTLSTQQQQQYKDMTKGQKDLSKAYYGSKQKMIHKRNPHVALCRSHPNPNPNPTPT